MLIRIGNALVDPAEVAAIVPDRLPGPEPAKMICIHTRTGTSFWIDASMNEAEAALIDAGYIEDTAGEPESVGIGFAPDL